MYTRIRIYIDIHMQYGEDTNDSDLLDSDEKEFYHFERTHGPAAGGKAASAIDKILGQETRDGEV